MGVIGKNSFFVFCFKALITSSIIIAWLAIGACDRVEKKVLPCDKNIILHNDNFQTEINSAISLNIHHNDTVNCAQLLDVRNPVFGSVSRQGNNIVYTPDLDFTGKDSLIYTITSGSKLYEAVARIWVIDPCKPHINPDTVILTLNESVNFYPAQNDSFCIGTTMVVAIAPQHGELVPMPNNGVKFIPQHGYTGSDFFIYKMCYENACSETKVTFYIHDNETCQNSFIPENDHLRVSQGQTITKSISELINNDGGCENDIDINSFTVVSTPEKGSINISSGFMFYTALSNNSGLENLRYRVCRKSRPNHCKEATIQIEIE